MLTVDREGERFVFENEWDILIPYSVERYDGRDAEVTVIPRASRTVRAALRRFSDDPFSDEALAWVWERIAPLQQEWGYIGGKYRWKRCRIYRAEKVLCEPMPETRQLTEADAGNNRTTYDIVESLRAGCLCVGTVIGGRVVSVAVSHSEVGESGDGEVIELGVETAPEARGMGYASSSLAYATEWLLGRGFTPEYRCTRSNRASAATAESVGYRKVGESLDLVMRRAPKR